MNFIQILLLTLAIWGWVAVAGALAELSGKCAHRGHVYVGKEVRFVVGLTIITTVALVISFTGYNPI